MSRLSSRRLDRAVTSALLALLTAVTVWNAFAYPSFGGFDAREHIAYVEEVLAGRLPEDGASYTPPGFYALAAGAIRVGETFGLEEPDDLVQLLNALCVVASGVLLLVLTRLLLPGRPLARWSALAFFACTPVVLKTGAMFHPQPLAMLLALVAFTTTVWMIVRGDYRLRLWGALAVSLVGAQLVRSVSIWVIAVVLVSLVAAAAAQPEHRRRIATTLALAALAVVLLPLPWYLHLQSSGGNPIFGREISLLSFDSPWPGTFYVDAGLPDVITHPQRAELEVAVIPILYAETWGDYFGIWSWGQARAELSPAVNRRLAVQSIVGLPLTAVALAGWFALVGLATSRWREAPAKIIVALGPFVAVAAVVYYATRSYRPDGDTVKALFLLPAVPLWAVSFGFAVDTVVERSPRVGAPMLGVLAACAVISLSYGTFALVS